MRPNLLILGGTTEASALARAVSEQGLRAVFSYAGRVAAPKSQPLPVRVGGFGGVDGLRTYLRDHSITHVIDATHPFAAQMSRNAVAACAAEGVPLVALQRSAWKPGAGDDWHAVADIERAVAALAGARKRVFLALGRLNLPAFTTAPQHHYVLRLVDAPDAPLPLPDCTVVVDRGPFSVAGDLALLRDHEIDLVVCKNSGGAGAEAKLVAARQLGLPVVMIDRPKLPGRLELATVADVLGWVGN
ncbi:cobalt-precorrin-6A reductase [Shimia biformata]|uniref:cobalt-precorrin-6A reductase n=1 Tax=Shimia biformata TaxID=1294299 RepID=UPI001951B188|nr:cobalt-precorrin-6A reductase [Shimia biformata]